MNPFPITCEYCITCLLEDEANPEQDPIKVRISSGYFGPWIEVLHPKTNQAITSASLDVFNNKIQLLGYAMLPDGATSQEVTSQAVLVDDYQAAIDLKRSLNLKN